MNNTELKNKLNKSLDFLKSELSQLRTGRASPSLLEEIEVEAYGGKMSVRELGSIMVLDPQNLAVAPWDRSTLKSISKAIRESELGLNPVEESDRIRIPIPALTEERRIEFTKVVSSKVEETKNSLRSTRQDAKKDIEKEFSDKIISEDEKFKELEDLENIVKEYISQADEIGESKKEDILRV